MVSAKDAELQDLMESVNELQEAAEIGLALAEAQKRRRDVGVGEGTVSDPAEEERTEEAKKELEERQAALEAKARELQAAAETQARQLEERQQLQQTTLVLHRQSSLQRGSALQRQVQQLREDLDSLRREFTAGVAAHTRDLQRLSAAMAPLCRLALRSAQLLKENIKLRNSLQDVRGAIRIFCRVRAMLPPEQEEGAPMVEVPAPLETGLPCREVIVLGSRPLSVAARIAVRPLVAQNLPVALRCITS